MPEDDDPLGVCPVERRHGIDRRTRVVELAEHELVGLEELWQTILGDALTRAT
jgi:hypothetical protein